MVDEHRQPEERIMTTAVTGATGHLGALVVDGLIERGTAAGDIVAVVRDAAKAQSLADRGVQVRVADYADTDALKAALAGVDKLLLVSGSDVGRRIAQHENVIGAAEAAGVSLIAYTSLLKADTSGLSLAPEHLATENRLAESSIPTVVLRNGWYWENYLGALQQAADSGVLLGAAGEGKLAAASRADFAAAAVEVLLAADQGGKVYELGGDERLTYAELAAVFTQVSGKPVEYKNVSEDEYKGVLEGAGLPGFVAEMLSSADAGIARGELDTDSGDLQKLIGRASTPVASVLG
ncbi:NAD(P)-dependent oxidoreductase [Rhodococcus sp. 06-156-3C]|nr:NAD(P)-dependent oxidoreductase [Rhodococcus sp. 06-418-1B]OZD11245.1 NAD(P)-dependent oxidoreductase [Rhodococcus sp. 06-156-3C]OZD13476.1 NAD(P)-dependent oxidoreductase [Rhodococcus sp. 06-156-4a]OZD22181.1 NAD(P)-dependent oxidoreductase [Rhodococcus sp. 06-156-4C]OZD30103.1 NAD(P)-dependent oxidoreductase [Rhodococcus sp. 06-156-3]OZD37508.1 NAD(P)-dependent oxidoreductase [Rhodococcus sp. 06-156-3b]OZD59319.1 NAD(P)-dependent oxidoreductase [Rhodococcus sp. 06-1059B-a]OZF70791.1 NAD